MRIHYIYNTFALNGSQKIIFLRIEEKFSKSRDSFRSRNAGRLLRHRAWTSYGQDLLSVEKVLDKLQAGRPAEDISGDGTKVLRIWMNGEFSLYSQKQKP